MRLIVCLLLFSLFSAKVVGQDMSKFKLYKPAENATEQIAQAVAQAKSSGRHVFIQIGGNWCIWCARFNDFVNNDKSIDSLLQANYVVYHLNYSKENENKPVLAKYGFPQRFGFPVFLVVNSEGKLIHTQNSAYLEEGKGYSREKVLEFFQQWTPRALDPAQYKEQ